MKKTIVSVIVFILLIQSVAAQGTAAEKITEGSNLRVTFLNQEPDPAGPGDALEVKFRIENIGGESAKDVEFEIIPSFPFRLEPGEEALRNLGTIQRSQADDNSVVVRYDLLISENAVEGDIPIDFRYRVNKEAWISLEDITIDIRTQDAILSIDSVDTGKKAMEPGSENTVSVTLANEADSNLRNIEVTLDLDDKPFVPLGSGNQKSVYQIKSNSKQKMQFSLLVDPEADSGVYKIPVTISYLDEIGTEFSKETTIGLIVGGAPDLSISLDETDIYQSGKAGEVTIKVVNKGVTDTKFMNVILSETEKFRLLSNNELYLGNIDSDDFESATFKIYVEKTEDQKIVLPITLEYKDATNNGFTDEIDIAMNLYSSNDAKKFGLEAGNGNTGIIIVVVIVVVGVFLYRRYKKKKNKK